MPTSAKAQLLFPTVSAADSFVGWQTLTKPQGYTHLSSFITIRDHEITGKTASACSNGNGFVSLCPPSSSSLHSPFNVAVDPSADNVVVRTRMFMLGSRLLHIQHRTCPKNTTGDASWENLLFSISVGLHDKLESRLGFRSLLGLGAALCSAPASCVEWLLQYPQANLVPTRG